MQKIKKDYLAELSVRQIRLEAKKSSIHLYSRKNKDHLIELILKNRENILIEDKTDIEGAEEEEKRLSLEKAKAGEKTNVFFDKNSYLKRLLSESFPKNNISIIENKDGSQTIFIL